MKQRWFLPISILISLLIMGCQDQTSSPHKSSKKGVSVQESTPQVAQPISNQSSANDRGHLPGKIVFQSNRDGDFEIFVINPDGSGLKQLTFNNAEDEYPTWSPDRSKILFVSNRDGHWNVYVMNVDGSNQIRLTDNKTDYASPTWSPDGKQILFDSKETSRWGIYIMNSDGTNKRPYKVESPWKENILANWSPDGSKVAFTSKRLMGWQVHVMNADGSDEKQLTNASGSCRPHFSPDSKKIAYVSTEGDGKGDIWIMDPDGSNKTRVTTDPNYDYHPSWSPDGTKIVYANTTDKKKADWNLFIINVDGSNPVQLTNDRSVNNHPDWK